MRRFGLAFLLLLPACVGGTLSNHDEIEEYPLRPATEKEGARLKRCLTEANKAFVAYHRRTKKYYRRAADLPVEAYCDGFLLSLVKTQNGYEIVAQFHENEQTVRWSVNQDDVIEEHLDEGSNLDPDVDFF